jgi:hypothetical protein
MPFKIKISADRLIFFYNKCVSSKNNSKCVWEMLREDESRHNTSHFIDPVDKTTLIENKGKIEKCLATNYLAIQSFDFERT